MNHFIELPDGTIINVAHVQRVYQHDVGSLNMDDPSELMTYVCFADGTRHEIAAWPECETFAYFESIAQKIGGDES